MTDIETLQRQLAALENYQFSLMRVGEDSAAADREEMRLLEKLSATRARIRELSE